MIIVLAFSSTNISNFPDTRRRRKGKGTKKRLTRPYRQR